MGSVNITNNNALSDAELSSTSSSEPPADDRLLLELTEARDSMLNARNSVHAKITTLKKNVQNSDQVLANKCRLYSQYARLHGITGLHNGNRLSLAKLDKRLKQLMQESKTESTQFLQLTAATNQQKLNIAKIKAQIADLDKQCKMQLPSFKRYSLDQLDTFKMFMGWEADNTPEYWEVFSEESQKGFFSLSYSYSKCKAAYDLFAQDFKARQLDLKERKMLLQCELNTTQKAISASIEQEEKLYGSENSKYRKIEINQLKKIFKIYHQILADKSEITPLTEKVAQYDPIIKKYDALIECLKLSQRLVDYVDEAANRCNIIQSGDTIDPQIIKAYKEIQQPIVDIVNIIKGKLASIDEFTADKTEDKQAIENLTTTANKLLKTSIKAMRANNNDYIDYQQKVIQSATDTIINEYNNRVDARHSSYVAQVCDTLEYALQYLVSFLSITYTTRLETDNNRVSSTRQALESIKNSPRDYVDGITKVTSVIRTGKELNVFADPSNQAKRKIGEMCTLFKPLDKENSEAANIKSADEVCGFKVPMVVVSNT